MRKKKWLRLVAVSVGPLLLSVVAPPALALPAPSQLTILRLIERLGSPSFPEREAATKALEAMGERALAALRSASKMKDAEIRRRSGRILDNLAERERKKLEGLWRATAVVVRGEREPMDTHEYVAVFAQDRLTIGATVGRYKRWWNGYRYNFTLDVGGHRGTMQLLPRYRDFDGHQAKIDDESPCGAIYVVDGDRLTLCLNMKGAERPAKFASEPGSGLMLFVFERPRASSAKAGIK